MVNLARVVGPALAGILIVSFGLSVCFILNAVSFLAVILALALMRPGELRTTAPGSERANLHDGLAYVRRTPAVLVPLLLMAVIGTLAYEFQVTLPLLAERTFGNANLYGSMSALQGAGAVLGGLTVAAFYRPRRPVTLARIALVFGVLMLGVAFAPTLGIALVAIACMGVGSIAFIAVGNTTLQLGADPAMRGRVMALWSVAFMGSTPIGGPLVGWVADQFGARVSVALGGVAAIVAALAVTPALRRVHAGQPGAARAGGDHALTAAG
jgi:predicted MFS family arabinose efflux permease